IDFSHFHHRCKGALGLRAAGGHRASEGARRDLPRQTPAILAPAAGALLPTIADDRVPVAVRLLLRIGRDLERKGLALWKNRAAIQAETRNAKDGKLYCEHLPLFPTRVIARCAVNRGHLAIR